MSNNSDENLQNFMEITQCTDPAKALQCLNTTTTLEEALILYFSIQDDPNQPSPQVSQNQPNPPTQNPYREISEHTNLNYNPRPTLNELTDEEKQYLSSRIRSINRKGKYDEKFGFSLKTAISYLWREYNSGELYNKSLDTTNHYFLKSWSMSLKDTLDFFDFHSKKHLLMLYVKQENSDLCRYIDNYVLGNKKIVKFVEKNLCFFGALKNDKEFKLLEKFEFKGKDVPFLTFLYYDQFGDLKVFKNIDINSDPKRNNSDQILKQIQEINDEFKNIRNEIENFQNNVMKKKQKLVERNRRNLLMQFEARTPNVNPLHNIAGPGGFGNLNQYPTPTLDGKTNSQVKRDRVLKNEQE